MPQLTVCPSCAERLEPEDNFCGNCGTSLAAPTAPDLRAQPSPPAGAAASATWAAPPHGAPPARATGPVTRSPGIRPSAPYAPTAHVGEAATQGTAPRARTGADDGDYGLAPPVATDPVATDPVAQAPAGE